MEGGSTKQSEDGNQKLQDHLKKIDNLEQDSSEENKNTPPTTPNQESPINESDSNQSTFEQSDIDISASNSNTPLSSSNFQSSEEFSTPTKSRVINRSSVKPPLPENKNGKKVSKDQEDLEQSLSPTTTQNSTLSSQQPSTPNPQRTSSPNHYRFPTSSNSPSSPNLPPRSPSSKKAPTSNPLVSFGRKSSPLPSAPSSPRSSSPTINNKLSTRPPSPSSTRTPSPSSPRSSSPTLSQSHPPASSETSTTTTTTLENKHELSQQKKKKKVKGPEVVRPNPSAPSPTTNTNAKVIPLSPHLLIPNAATRAGRWKTKDEIEEEEAKKITLLQSSILVGNGTIPSSQLDSLHAVVSKTSAMLNGKWKSKEEIERDEQEKRKQAQESIVVGRGKLSSADVKSLNVVINSTKAIENSKWKSKEEIEKENKDRELRAQSSIIVGVGKVNVNQISSLHSTTSVTRASSASRWKTKEEIQTLEAEKLAQAKAAVVIGTGTVNPKGIENQHSVSSQTKAGEASKYRSKEEIDKEILEKKEKAKDEIVIGKGKISVSEVSNSNAVTSETKARQSSRWKSKEEIEVEEEMKRCNAQASIVIGTGKVKLSEVGSLHVLNTTTKFVENANWQKKLEEDRLTSLRFRPPTPTRPPRIDNPNSPPGVKSDSTDQQDLTGISNLSTITTSSIDNSMANSHLLTPTTSMLNSQWNRQEEIAKKSKALVLSQIVIGKGKVKPSDIANQHVIVTKTTTLENASWERKKELDKDSSSHNPARAWSPPKSTPNNNLGSPKKTIKLNSESHLLTPTKALKNGKWKSKEEINEEENILRVKAKSTVVIGTGKFNPNDIKNSHLLTTTNNMIHQKKDKFTPEIDDKDLGLISMNSSTSSISSSVQSPNSPSRPRSRSSSKGHHSEFDSTNQSSSTSSIPIPIPDHVLVASIDKILSSLSISPSTDNTSDPSPPSSPSALLSKLPEQTVRELVQIISNLTDVIGKDNTQLPLPPSNLNDFNSIPTPSSTSVLPPSPPTSEVENASNNPSDNIPASETEEVNY